MTRPDGERFVSVLDRRLVAYAQAREGPLVHRPGAHYGERSVVRQSRLASTWTPEGAKEGGGGPDRGTDPC